MAESRWAVYDQCEFRPFGAARTFSPDECLSPWMLILYLSLLSLLAGILWACLWAWAWALRTIWTGRRFSKTSDRPYLVGPPGERSLSSAVVLLYLSSTSPFFAATPRRLADILPKMAKAAKSGASPKSLRSRQSKKDGEQATEAANRADPQLRQNEERAGPEQSEASC